MRTEMLTHFIAFVLGGACGVFALALVIVGSDEK